MKSEIVINKCIKCRSDDIKVWNCGYSSFNVGGAKCNSCGQEHKVNNCDWGSNDGIIKNWNFHNPTIDKHIENLKKSIENHEKRIEEIKEEIKEYVLKGMEEKYIK